MDSTLLQSARQVLLAEARALEAASARLDGEFDRAVDLLAAHAGKVLVTGIGKSGIIAQKITATFCSVGQPAVSACTHPATPPSLSPAAATPPSCCDW
jgi:arabinose-5-phosphate isomerase